VLAQSGALASGQARHRARVFSKTGVYSLSGASVAQIEENLIEICKKKKSRTPHVRSNQRALSPWPYAQPFPYRDLMLVHQILVKYLCNICHSVGILTPAEFWFFVNFQACSERLHQLFHSGCLLQHQILKSSATSTVKLVTSMQRGVFIYFQSFRKQGQSSLSTLMMSFPRPTPS
jgi:hypothetical protein